MLDKLKEIHDSCFDFLRNNESIFLLNTDCVSGETRVLFNMRMLEDYMEATEGLHRTVIYSQPGNYEINALKGGIRFVIHLNRERFREYEQLAGEEEEWIIQTLNICRCTAQTRTKRIIVKLSWTL